MSTSRCTVVSLTYTASGRPVRSHIEQGVRTFILAPLCPSLFMASQPIKLPCTLRMPITHCRLHPECHKFHMLTFTLTIDVRTCARRSRPSPTPNTPLQKQMLTGCDKSSASRPCLACNKHWKRSPRSQCSHPLITSIPLHRYTPPLAAAPAFSSLESL